MLETYEKKTRSTASYRTYLSLLTLYRMPGKELEIVRDLIERALDEKHVPNDA